MTTPEIQIQGGYELSGELAIQGSKNSFQKIVAASVAIPGEFAIEDVPDIQDATSLLAQFESVGGVVSREGNNTILDSTSVSPVPIDPTITKRSRGSILFAGAMLGRFGRAEIGLPGGDDFGVRPINYSLQAFRMMGAKVTEKSDRIILEEPKYGLLTSDITFPEPTISGTANALIAAAASQTYVKLNKCAYDPDIQDLLDILGQTGNGNVITVNPSDTGYTIEVIPSSNSLTPEAKIKLNPDRNALATFAIAGAMLGDELTLTNANIYDTLALWWQLSQAGVRLNLHPEENIAIVSHEEFSQDHLAIEGCLLPPDFLNDWGPQIQVLMSQLPSGGTYTEGVQVNRFAHVPELVRMGATASLRRTSTRRYIEGQHWSPYDSFDECLYRGPSPLTGTEVVSRDIRNGAALVLAGLIAEGKTTVHGADHIHRGYEDIVGSLQSVGAQIV